MEKGPINQKQLAEMLDLSTTTVSRSLRNHSSIHPATRARVLEAASRLGYRLPAKVTTPREAGIQTVQVLIAHPAGFEGDPSPAGQRVLAGISDVAAAMDVQISVHFVPPDDAEAQLAAFRRSPAVRAGLLSGVILMKDMDAAGVEALNRDFPCVAITRRYPGVPVDAVDTDQVEAVSSLVEHMAGRGHEKIGFLAWGRSRPWELTRFAGYREGMHRVGKLLDPTCILNLEGECSSDDPQTWADKIEACPGVTAWICVTDYIAYELMREMSRRGRAIGPDFELSGYDGVRPPPGCPQIPTVRVPFGSMGQAALELLLTRLRDRVTPRRLVLIEHELVLPV